MPEPTLADDCFAHAGKLLTHAEAIAEFKSRIVPVASQQTVALTNAAGRILSQPVRAPHPVPLHTNAAVDGYAFAWPESDDARSRAWPIAGRAAAGQLFVGMCPPDAVVRILTGAVLPDGTDTVVMQEDVTLQDRSIVMTRRPKRGANVRKAGEDIATGTEALGSGHRLRPQDLAALASMGVANVDCYAPLKVAILSTGDEVRAVGSGPLAVGEVFDANAPMLTALLEATGAIVTDLGILKDEPDRITATLASAARTHDVILTSGGASRGDEDHMAAAIGSLGTRHFWQIAVKPGRPMMFGQIGRSVIVGLPGNPVAVFVCYLMYVYPLLMRLAGSPWIEPLRYPLPAAFAIADRKPDRREFWRGMLVTDGGQLKVDKYARDGSGLISGLRVADGLIDIAENRPSIAPGDLVDFIPFSEFGIAARGL